MAVKIRLRRMGAKKAPYYRVVVADSRYPRDGRFIEEIGTYNPLTDPATVAIDAEKAKAWIANGAQPTDTVRALLKKNGVLPSSEVHDDESIVTGLLEYPQYTRPRVFEGLAVPEVLLGGDHEEIRKWRLARAFERTLEKRPELLELLKGEEPLDRRDETKA